MREFKFINFNKGKNYYLIEINRPDQLNAINKETIKELKDCFLSIKNSTKGFYGVIITGSGDKSFVAGADISEFKGLNEKTAKELSLNGHELFHIIENFSIPVIALVNGYALGGGCELSLACHLRIATKNAQFSQPEINLGLIPGYGGTQRLSQIVGKSKALEIMLTANMISAQKAYEYNLVNDLAKNYNEALKKAHELILIFKRKAPVAIKNVIRSVNNYYDINVDGFQEEINLFVDCSKTKDFNEGVKAFIEKRCPDFTGE